MEKSNNSTNENNQITYTNELPLNSEKANIFTNSINIDTNNHLNVGVSLNQKIPPKSNHASYDKTNLSCCILWSSIPVLTQICPFLGHSAITK